MVTKKFFIKKTTQDLITEQIKIIGNLLAKQAKEGEKTPVTPPDLAKTEDPHKDLKIPYSTSDDEFYFDDEIPYIPPTQKSSATINSISTTKVNFDEDSVDKLRRAKNNAQVD